MEEDLSGSDTEASDGDIQCTLLNAIAREANCRANATYSEMVARESPSSSSATPAPMSASGVTMQPQTKAKPRMPKTSAPKSRGGWRRIDDDGDSTDVDQIAAPSDTPAPSVETADTPAPSVETNSTPAPSVETDSTPATEPSAGPYPCPISKLVPIEWNDVRYFTDESGWVKFDTKNSPLPLPHPNMEFRGYIENTDGSVSAFSTDRTRRGQPGTRMPKKRAGVVQERVRSEIRKVERCDAVASISEGVAVSSITC